MRNSNFALRILTIFFGVLLSFISVSASTPPEKKTGTTVSGVIKEVDKSSTAPLEFAVIAFPDYGISVASKEDGSYILRNVPLGKTRVTVSYVGKVPIDEVVDIKSNMTLDFTMQDENFKIKEVTVLAKAGQAGEATASIIGRSAMDHMQATSLSDVMSLLPGGLTTEPNLSSAKSLNIRTVSSSGTGMNALGTAIIRDGAPMSNNANLSAMNPTVAGSTSTNAGGASPSSGIDLRSISTDNIESIEVIRGIPSVEHGDLTSGAVIINSKAGREPLRITGKFNPKVYMGSVGTGFLLGEKRGAMNINADYAHNTNDPTESYHTYQRVSARVLYSKEINQSLRSNTSVNFVYGKDGRALNPDDENYKRASRAEEYGVTLNTNGTWNINKGIMKSLRYVVSGTYTSKQSFYQSMLTSNNTPYSMTYTDGAVLSNFAGQHIMDKNGVEITNFGAVDQNNYSVCLPANYFSRYNIDSREVNVFAKLVGTMFKQTGMINNRILFGADFRSDGNVGHGKTFDPTAPPQREVSNQNANFRPRDYRDIPFINQVGVFAEENFSWQMGLHLLKIQAGVRYDHASVVGGIVSPRFNASFEVLPNKIWIRGGYGVTAKMPSLMYLHPEKAYFEYINLNELASSAIPEDERLYITTTRVIDVSTENLKIATNHKSEVGLDMKFGQTTIAATAFEERVKNGYGLMQTFDGFSPFQWIEYKSTYNKTTGEHTLEQKSINQVLSYWYTPGNNSFVTTRGVEFDINFGRIDKINTTISLNGSYMRSKAHTTGYDFYDPTSTMSASGRKDIAIYSKEGNYRYDEQMSTALRITHNLPSIGFAVTLTAQTVWKDANWGKYGNDELPIGYMPLKDNEENGIQAGKPVFFEPGTFITEEEFRNAGMGHMLKVVTHPLEVRESYKPYWCFNVNATKEIGDILRVSFFANNMFRSYPRRESLRNPGSFVRLNNRFYFGIELALTI
ncbi:MAG: TonB-dependent receptor [Bacteroides sp.]|nr:TonB-dependent receptor [Bacteroides sp.]